MVVRLTPELKEALVAKGVECFLASGVAGISEHAVFEPPCSMKWMSTMGRVRLGAFSYAVSGYFQDVSIARYTSIGESVQIGRASHALDWLSTSPFFYLAHEKMFNIGDGFAAAPDYHGFAPDRPPPDRAATHTRPITIGNDVWIGHGAFVMPGVTVGDGAVIGAGAIVTKDVPAYAMVAGVPATIKKVRVSEHLIGPLLDLQWWRFAPWDLKGVPFWDVEQAISVLQERLPSLRPYRSESVNISQLSRVPAPPS